MRGQKWGVVCGGLFAVDHFPFSLDSDVQNQPRANVIQATSSFCLSHHHPRHLRVVSLCFFHTCIQPCSHQWLTDHRFVYYAAFVWKFEIKLHLNDLKSCVVSVFVELAELGMWQNHKRLSPWSCWSCPPYVCELWKWMWIDSQPNTIQ